MDTQRVAAVVGVGPGLGAAVARRFAREGFHVGLLARNADTLHAVREDIRQEGGSAEALPADATDAGSLARALALLRERHGEPEVLVYNAGHYHVAGVLEVTPTVFEEAWRTLCLGGLLSAQAVLPGMLARGRGTLLFTGATASLRGGARFSSLAVGKAGLRMLAQSMARELGPRGIHVAHVVIDGLIDTARVRQMTQGQEHPGLLAPDAIAETYWQLHCQPRSAWTHELDLRPASERF